MEFLSPSDECGLNSEICQSVFINDIDGNCFKISDVTKLDAQSLRRIEIYL